MVNRTLLNDRSPVLRCRARPREPRTTVEEEGASDGPAIGRPAVRGLVRRGEELRGDGDAFASRTSSRSRATAARRPGRARSSGSPATLFADKSFDAQSVRGPFFNGPDPFAVHFTHQVTPEATGRQVTLEEVGVYRVKDDKITREPFFFAGGTLRRLGRDP